MHETSTKTTPIWLHCFSAASFDRPLYVADSVFAAHGPFLLWLAGALRPRRVVQLGIGAGSAYFALCQSLRAHAVPAECSAIAWPSGRDEAVLLHSVDAYNRSTYADFSRVLPLSPIDALSRFETGSIDLLLLGDDDPATVEVEHLADWLPRLSDRGVVLVGDGPATRQLRTRHPGFTFLHGGGLHAIGVGDVPPPAFRLLLDADLDDTARDIVRRGYARLGEGIVDHARAAAAGAAVDRQTQTETELARAALQADALRTVVARLLADASRGEATRATMTAIARQLARVERRTGKAQKRTARLVDGLADTLSRRSLFGWGPTATKTTKRKRTRRKGEGKTGQGPAKVNAAPATPAPPLPTPPPPTPGPMTASEGLVDAAIAVVRNEGWAASEPMWQEIHDRKLIVPRPAPAESQPAVDGVFEEVTPRSTRRDTLRWCIYTTLFGAYDDLRAPVDPPDGIDLLCFTDTDARHDGWRSIKVDTAEGPIRDSRRYKLLPHRFLADYDASLYVDANLLLSGDIGRFVRRWCLDRPMVMWRHAVRCDVYDEAIAVLARSKADPARVVRQMVEYEAAGLPRSTGLVEASFMWRDHRDAATRTLMEAWDGELRRQSARDQFSLGYLMWKTGIRPQVFPASLGTARRNVVSSTVPHYAVGDKHRIAVPRPAMRRLPGKRRIAFLVDETYATSGSTLMRGHQLADIVRSHLGEHYDVEVGTDLDVRDAIVVLTKGRLQRISAYEMQRVARAAAATIADFVDDPVRPNLLEFLDVLWASSIGALNASLATRPLIATDLVTHHVDPRIPRCAPAARFAAGYFGEPTNAVLTEEIARSVTVVPVDTKAERSGDGWIAELGEFSLHYAVRPTLPPKIHKPFLKGFVAARSGANIMIDRSDGDALAYLGEDYPYLLPDNTPATILAGVEFARQSFGSPTWRDGLEVMRHVETLCTPERVAHEVSRSLRRFE